MGETAPTLPWGGPAARRSVNDPPHVDLLAMVWGPRFDREHAMAFADRFDAMPPHAQEAVRRTLLRVAENAACPASC